MALTQAAEALGVAQAAAAAVQGGNANSNAMLLAERQATAVSVCHDGCGQLRLLSLGL